MHSGTIGNEFWRFTAVPVTQNGHHVTTVRSSCAAGSLWDSGAEVATADSHCRQWVTRSSKCTLCGGERAQRTSSSLSNLENMQRDGSLCLSINSAVVGFGVRSSWFLVCLRTSQLIITNIPAFSANIRSYP